MPAAIAYLECTLCGHHVPAHMETVCPIDGAPLATRYDTSPEAMKRRREALPTSLPVGGIITPV